MTRRRQRAIALSIVVLLRNFHSTLGLAMCRYFDRLGTTEYRVQRLRMRYARWWHQVAAGLAATRGTSVICWAVFAIILVPAFGSSPDVLAEKPLKLVSESEWPHRYTGGLHFSPDGALLATWGGDDASVTGSDGDAKPDGLLVDGHLTLWDTRTWNRCAEVEFPGEMPLSTSFSPDGEIVACGFISGAVKLYDVETGDMTKLAADAGQIVQFAAQRHILAVSAFGGRVTLWDVETNELLAANENGGGFVNNHRPIAFSPNGQYLAVGRIARAGQEAHEITLCDTTALDPVASLQADSRQVSSLAFSADGGKLYSLSNNGLVVVCDVETREEITQFRAFDEREGNDFGEIVVSHDGRLFATSGRESVKVWKTDGHQLLETIVGKRRSFRWIDIDPSGEHLATMTSSEARTTARLEVWRVGNMTIAPH